MVSFTFLHYNTYFVKASSFSIHEGTTLPGEEAEKKRQHPNGRNYYIRVPRPSLIEDYQKNFGWVDRHNRFRQNILGLHKVWKTKRWQTRFIYEFFGIVLVDAFLLARKFMARWKHECDEESIFWKFVRVLLPQFHDENLHCVRELTKCRQVLIGKKEVQSGISKGRKIAIQARCKYCIRAKRKEIRSSESSSEDSARRSRRTAYSCICHPKDYVCKEGLGTCWTEHLQEYDREGDSDQSDTDDSLNEMAV